MDNFSDALNGPFIFVSEPLLKFRGRKLQLIDEIKIIIGRVTVVVPELATTNGASVPWLLSGIIPRFHDDYNLGSLVHDSLVGEDGQKKAIIIIDGVERQATWKEAAMIMKRIMQNSGSSKLKVSAFKFSILSWGKIRKLFS